MQCSDVAVGEVEGSTKWDEKSELDVLLFSEPPINISCRSRCVRLWVGFTRKRASEDKKLSR